MGIGMHQMREKTYPVALFVLSKFGRGVVNGFGRAGLTAGR